MAGQSGNLGVVCRPILGGGARAPGLSQEVGAGIIHYGTSIVCDLREGVEDVCEIAGR